MLSLETYPAYYLGYINAYSSNFSTSSSKPSNTSTGNTIHCSRYKRAPYTPFECSTCGVSLRTFKKCWAFHRQDNMTAHLCITTYRSPNNEVLKLECNATMVGYMDLGVNLRFIEDGLPTGQKQLCFVGQDCQRIPSILGATYGLQTKRLDLSYNAIRSLEGLEKFPHLEELILDNNFIDDSVTLPRLDTLQTLSLNKNKISNLDKFLDQVSEMFPQLRYLSLLGNEACPNQLSSLEKDEKDYRRYRLYVLHHLQGLRFLDSTPVRKSEVREARKRGALMKTARPTSPLSTQTSNVEADNHNGPTKKEHQQKTNTPEPKNHSQNGSAVKRGDSPDSSQTQPSHTSTYGVCRYRYVGNHSEGNRFINNEHL